MIQRRLGNSQLEVSALGLGCWVIGGPWTFVDHPAGWGKVEDAESLRALEVALDSGINFYDTAANYDCGHSERLLGKALARKRDQVITATKFGYSVDEEKRLVTPKEDIMGSLRQECEASLRRLNTDYIDLYQFHVGDYDPTKAAGIREILEKLVEEGKIRWYGWSTDNPVGARVFAQGEHCVAIQHLLNMARDHAEMLAVCDGFNLASINRTPLGGGMLTGKFSSETTFPQDDIRSSWNLGEGWQAERLKQVSALRQLFSGDGRTLAQVALDWLWARSECTIPIPGFKTTAQVLENVKAMEFRTLSGSQMLEIDRIFGRTTSD